jgi:hypothetical protein
VEEGAEWGKEGTEDWIYHRDTENTELRKFWNSDLMLIRCGRGSSPEFRAACFLFQRGHRFWRKGDSRDLTMIIEASRPAIRSQFQKFP